MFLVKLTERSLAIVIFLKGRPAKACARERQIGGMGVEHYRSNACVADYGTIGALYDSMYNCLEAVKSNI